MTCLIGVDIGTTSTIGILIDTGGEVLATATRPVTLLSPRAGWAEEDPEEWWCNLCAITAELMRAVAARGARLAGIGVTGMLPAVVLLDAAGRLLRPSIQQSDGRCGAEVAAMRREADEAAFIARAGNGINQQLVGAKIRWLERHEPDVHRRIATVFGSYDYVNWRLTGRRAVEQNWALEAGFVDLGTQAVADDLVAFAHLPRAAVPGRTLSHQILGPVTAEAAAATGLPAGLPVVGGAADHIASALAAGLVAPGQMLLKFGGSVDVLTVSERAAPDPRMYLDHHLIPDLFVPNGCMATGGSGLNWFARTFAGREADAARASGRTLHQHLDALAAAVPAGADGVTVLPYFLGEKTPIHDPAARGLFAGLSLNHGLPHLWRALLEAYAYALAHHVETLRDMGHAPTSFVASDGGAQSRVWMQIVADVLGAPVALLKGHPGSCLGAAWTAAIGTGAATDWRGIGRFVSPDEVVRPQAGNAEVYAQGYRKFRELYRGSNEGRSV